MLSYCTVWCVLHVLCVRLLLCVRQKYCPWSWLACQVTRFTVQLSLQRRYCWFDLLNLSSSRKTFRMIWGVWMNSGLLVRSSCRGIFGWGFMPNQRPQSSTSWVLRTSPSTRNCSCPFWWKRRVRMSIHTSNFVRLICHESWTVSSTDVSMHTPARQRGKEKKSNDSELGTSKYIWASNITFWHHCVVHLLMPLLHEPQVPLNDNLIHPASPHCVENPKNLRTWSASCERTGNVDVFSYLHTTQKPFGQTLISATSNIKSELAPIRKRTAQTIWRS